MGDWLIPFIIIAAAVIVIGNFSTFQKNAKTPLRKKGLNDLEETLPRSNKTQHVMPNVPDKDIHNKHTANKSDGEA